MAEAENPRVNLRQARVLFSAIGIIVSTFDLCSDWWAFSNFYPYDSGKKTLTICLGVVCSIATILFFMEFYQGCKAFAVYCRRKKSREPVENGGETNNASGGREAQKKQEHKVERLQEIITFLLLVFEDIPSAIILYATFKLGNCRLYQQIFDETIVAYLSLSGVFASAMWKGLQSLIYCIQCCRFYDMKNCEEKAVCCICRLLRPFIAVVLVMFVSFLFIYFYFDLEYSVKIGEFSFGLGPRYDCINQTEALNHTYTTQSPLS